MSKRNGFSRHKLLRRRTIFRRTLTVEPLEQRRLLASISIAVQQPPTIREDAPGQLTYTLTRDDDPIDTLTVKFELTGSADFDVDYKIRTSEQVKVPEDPPVVQPMTATAKFEPGESTVNVRMDPQNDTNVEGDETVTLTIVEADRFGVVAGAAALRVRGEDTVYYVVDDQNRLASVDLATGCLHVIGVFDSGQIINDIAFTADGDLFAISADNLYEVDFQNPVAGLIPTRNLGMHEIEDANALIDSRDGDFSSEEGDLFAMGTDSLEISRIDLEQVDAEWMISDVTEVFDIATALGNILFPTDYQSSGDLDYAGTNLVLTAARAADDFDVFIAIETPGNAGIVKAPREPEVFDESFQNIDGLAFDGNMTFGFAGHTMLTINRFTLDAATELQLTGKTYDIADNDTATGTIEELALPNDPPSIDTDIPDQIIVANTSTGPIPFTISDDLTPPNLLIVDATSSDLTLIPADGIALGGVGANRTINITPAAGMAGSATITITVDDGLLQTDQDFLVTVNGAAVAVDDPDAGVNRDDVVHIRVLDNDEGDVDISSVRIRRTPDNGDATARADGTIDYQANPGFFGIDTFDYDIADSDGIRSGIATVTVRVVESGLQNPNIFLDVDDDGEVMPLDALLIINQLARIGIVNVADDERGPPFLDVDGNGIIEPLDALLVINLLAKR